jgi:hypothetical protein
MDLHAFEAAMELEKIRQNIKSIEKGWGLKFEPDTEFGQKEVFFKGVKIKVETT